MKNLTGQEVVVEGHVQKEMLTVSRISPLSANHANNARRPHQGRVS
jgi:hypothetical protein